MVGGEHGHPPVVEQRVAREVVVLERPPHHRQVGVAGAHAARRVGEVEVAYGHRHVRAVGGERAQDARRDVERGGGEQPDGQLAGLPGRRPARRAQRVVHAGQQRRRGLEQRPPRGREVDAACGALQQPRPDAQLELADLRAQRGLREVEPLGRAREVELLGDRDERAQVPELDV